MALLMDSLGGLVALSPFTVKLVVGELSFAAHFRRKERFLLRLIASIFLQLCLSVGLFLAFQNTNSWIVQNTVYYLLLFIVSALFLRLLFRESIADLVPCAVAGYLTEHIATQVFQLLFGDMVREISSGTASMGRTIVFVLADLAVFVFVSGLTWFLFVRNTATTSGSQELNRSMLPLSVVMLVVILVLSSVRDQYAHESQVLMVVTRLFSVFCCLFLLYIRYDILESSKLAAEREELARIITLERKQFEQSRENIELINIKCHDMRHRMETWEHQGGQVDPEELAEMKRLIGIYDSSIRTGNDILDTILTERSLYCEKHGIRLSCIVDGEKLGFMGTGDICALFGNAIENAIEAVSKLSSPEDRIITFQVRESRAMLVITVENYYTGDLTVKNGLPISTKGDDWNHGFGMKSIRNVAEKYGGKMDVLVDELFHLTILIPIPG